MKAYLAITGVLFALLALVHLYRIAHEWNGFNGDFWFVFVTAAIALAFAAWAWRLFMGLNRAD